MELFKDKKGISGSTIVIILITFIFIIGILVTLLVVLNNEVVQKQIDEGESNINLYIQAKDSYSNVQIDGNYIILNKSNIIKGKLGDSYTEINNLSSNLSYLILASSNGFYSNLLNKSVTQEEKNANISKVDIYLDKIGELSVTNTGNIEEGEKRITLNISAKDYFNRLEICVSWTSGITYVFSKPELICPDNWGNVSGKVCSCRGIEENCDAISGSICYPTQKEIPNRFKDEADRCFYYGNNLKDSYVLVPFTIKSENLNSLDFVDFYIIDNDIVYSNGFKYMNEYLGNNLGSEDYKFEVSYETGQPI